MSGVKHVVYLDMQIVNLRLVDARQSSFSASGILYYAWRDDTLVGTADGKPYGPPTAVNNLFAPNHVWSNRLGTVTEQNALFVVRPAPPAWTGVDPVASGSEAWVAYSVEVTATFLQPQNLREFPYDTQTVLMELESRQHSTATMVWQLAPDIYDDLSPSLGQPDGFNISDVTAAVDVSYYPKVGLETSRAKLGLVLDRDPAFFVSSFVQPLSLTMCMTILSIAMLPVGQIGPRNGAATGGIGTTVSWVFVTSNMVPVLPYPTRLHSYLRFCFFLFAAIFVYNAVAYVALDRYKTQMESARKSFNGRLAFCCACCGVCALPALEGDKKKEVAGKDDKDAAGKSSAAVRDSSSSSAASEGKESRGELTVVDMDHKADAAEVVEEPPVAKRGGAAKAAAGGDAAAEATLKLLQHFLDKAAEEKAEKDKEKAKKEFKTATACIPGSLADFSARVDLAFMLVFFAVYIVGTVLILKGPLPNVVLQ